MSSLPLVAERLAIVRERIRAAGGTDVQVVAVTKTFGVDAVLAAAAAGSDGIGENYAQELIAKLTALDDADRRSIPPVHFIGQLQTNKVRSIAPYVDVYETVDRESLAAEVAKRVPGATVLVQVRPDGEPHGKGGCALDEAPRLVERCRELGLHPVGMMTVGPTEGGPEAARAGFRAVRTLVDRLGLAVCSMGMTADLEVAVQEGSTQVRVGSALFGPRAS
ncbi:MAG: YggS family pyridoxal phosphate enzyme [Ilumatobacteraceae bacterium]